MKDTIIVKVEGMNIEHIPFEFEGNEEKIPYLESSANSIEINEKILEILSQAIQENDFSSGLYRIGNQWLIVIVYKDLSFDIWGWCQADVSKQFLLTILSNDFRQVVEYGVKSIDDIIEQEEIQ